MFTELREVWLPIQIASKVSKKPLAVRIDGVDLTLFRGQDGKVGALVDRCPHRGVKLSLGTVGKDGCLECPFHGWRFATDGACVDVPLSRLTAERRARMAAQAVPVREAGGLIWIYTGQNPTSEPPVPEALLQPGWSRFYYSEVWNTHFTRAMENMLDFPHVPFIHRTTIGRGLRSAMRPDSEMTMAIEPTARGAKFIATMDGKAQGFIDWIRPCGMELSPEFPLGKFRAHIFCVPIDAEHTSMLIAGVRSFFRYNPLGLLFDRFNRFVLFQDRSVVESSQPRCVPKAGLEKSVANDGPTLYFRKYYLKTQGHAESE